MRLRSIVLLTIASLLVVVMTGLGWMHGRRAEVQARLDAFLAEQEQRNAMPVHGREAVYGGTLDGDAADHYVAATRELEPHGLSVRDTDTGRRLLQRDQPLSPAVREQLAPSLAAALSSMRSGVRCSRLSRGAKYERALLATVVADAVDRAFAANEVDKAVELFVDQCVYAIDATKAPRLPPFRDEWLRQLDARTDAFFADELRRVDERWPRFSSAESLIASMIRMCSGFGPLDQSFTQALGAHEFGFDVWCRNLVLCDELRARLPELSPPAEHWPRRQAQLAAFGAMGAEPGASNVIPVLLQAEERGLREGLTQLRFLRLAVAFVTNQELPRLDDPLGGGAIEVEIRGDEATFRSEGIDGKKRLERTVRRR